MVPVLVMSDRPFAKSPDTPTTVELGVDATMATLRGVGALKGVPEERLEKLESAFLAAMECEEYQNYLATNGLSPDSIADGETTGSRWRSSRPRTSRRKRDAEPVSERSVARDPADVAESAGAAEAAPVAPARGWAGIGDVAVILGLA